MLHQLFAFAELPVEIFPDCGDVLFVHALFIKACRATEGSGCVKVGLAYLQSVLSDKTSSRPGVRCSAPNEWHSAHDLRLMTSACHDLRLDSVNLWW